MLNSSQEGDSEDRKEHEKLREKMLNVLILNYVEAHHQVAH